MNLKLKNVSMKNYLGSLAYASAIGMSLILASCSKNDTPAPSKTILQIVASGTNFTFLKVAAIKTGLSTDLGASTKLTVFAPTDQAFKDAGFADTNAVKNADNATLTAILSHHVIVGSTTTSSIPTAKNTAFPSIISTTLIPDNLYVTKTSTGSVYVDGVSVTQADIIASNGVIHQINKVLNVPGQNLADYLTSKSTTNTPQFTLLLEAINRCNLTSTFSGVGTFTLFAPTDAAFAAAGLDTKAKVDAYPVGDLTAILKLHVLTTRVFSTDIVSGNVATLNGANITISTGVSGLTVSGAKNTTPAAIAKPAGVPYDVACNNGVLHSIDQLLLP